LGAAARERVLTVLGARGLNRRQLADQVGILHNTLGSSLLPQGRAPSQANMAKIRKWLEATEPEKAESSSSPSPSAPARSSPIYRLTAAQREKLAGYVELDQHALRKTVGVTRHHQRGGRRRNPGTGDYRQSRAISRATANDRGERGVNVFWVPYFD
jgi:hypothetical protein